MKGVIEYGLIIVLVVIVIVAIASIFNGPTIEGEIRETESGMEYEFFYIEGMPCIYVGEGSGRSATGGPSCDWSKWKGEGR